MQKNIAGIFAIVRKRFKIIFDNGSHPRADGDGDGIPCENVCQRGASPASALKRVKAIQRNIGCRR